MFSDHDIAVGLCQYDEPDWQPLYDIVGVRLADWFTWMFEIELDEGVHVHGYKHIATWRYFHIGVDGRAFVYVPGGSLSAPGRYREIDRREAIDLVFETWEELARGPDDDDRAALKQARCAAGAKARASRGARGSRERRETDGQPESRITTPGSCRSRSRRACVVSAVRHEATDPDGRVVVVDSRTLWHLTRRRPQMAAHVAVILDTVARPDVREDDPAPGRERFYRRDLDPRRWLRVVVDFNDAPAFVVTAFRPGQRAGEHVMNVTIAGTTFDQHEHDARGDVLYLSAGAPRAAARTLATPEGHAMDYDESGAVIGMVLVNARFLLERDGAVTVTVPPDRVVAAQLAAALVAG